jgi:spore germination protein Q
MVTTIYPMGTPMHHATPQQMTPPHMAAQPAPQFPVFPGGSGAPGQPGEESYIENILRLNLGKVATIYMTFEGNNQWNAKVFRGVVEAAGKDHIIISEPGTGKRDLLLMVNLDYMTFDEPLTYNLPFGRRA